MLESVDNADLKSAEISLVRVQVPPPAPRQKNAAPFRFRGCVRAAKTAYPLRPSSFSDSDPLTLGSESVGSGCSYKDSYAPPNTKSSPVWVGFLCLANEWQGELNSVSSPSGSVAERRERVGTSVHTKCRLRHFNSPRLHQSESPIDECRQDFFFVFSILQL